MVAEAKATLRFETPPGQQLQIDFGQLRVPIADQPERVYLFVATLGYSRRCYAEAFDHQAPGGFGSAGWKAPFGHIGGVTSRAPAYARLPHGSRGHLLGSAAWAHQRYAACRVTRDRIAYIRCHRPFHVAKAFILPALPAMALIDIPPQNDDHK